MCLAHGAGEHADEEAGQGKGDPAESLSGQRDQVAERCGQLIQMQRLQQGSGQRAQEVEGGSDGRQGDRPAQHMRIILEQLAA